MIERGVDVSFGTIRRWGDKFGLTYAKRIKSSSERPSPVWHLDEVYMKIVTGRLWSYGAALKVLRLKHLQGVGGSQNNRAEYSPFLSDEENEKHNGLGR